MRTFLASVGLVYVACTATLLVMNGPQRQNPGFVLAVILTTLVLPVASAWVGAEAARFMRPVRILATRDSSALCRMAAGGMAGILGCMFTLGAVVYFSEPIASRGDSWFTGPIAALTAFLVVLPWPRVRRGTCRGCAYDLAALTPACKGLCPECGTDLMKCA